MGTLHRGSQLQFREHKKNKNKICLLPVDYSMGLVSKDSVIPGL